MNWEQLNNMRKPYIRFAERVYMRMYAAIRRNIKAELNTAQSMADLERIFGSVPIGDEVHEAFDMVYQHTGVAFAKATYKRLKNIKAAEPIETVEPIWRSFMIEFVATFAGLKIDSVIRTHRADYKRLLDQSVAIGQEQGWGMDKIASEILKAGTRREKWKAMRIARTEILSASNYGSMQGALTVGTPINKVWLQTQSKEPREDHLEMVGHPVDITMDFVLPSGVHMQYPGDPSAPLDEIINCSCGIDYVPKEDIITQILGY